jgi:UDP-N-acetylmuramoylalanine--D-glutamate ligase
LRFSANQKQRQATRMQLRQQHIVVVGLGVTGYATAKFLARRGASVVVSDAADADQLTPLISDLRRLEVRLEFGPHQVDTLCKADLIVVSPGVPHNILPLVTARDQGIPVMGEIELASRFITAPIVAITGTNGKTTTAALVAEMLKQSGTDVFLGGNIGQPLIGYADEPQRAAVVVAEVSSFQLDTIDTFRPRVGVCLNVSEDHLDRYTDFEAYAASKARLFENQREHDIAILNGADRHMRALHGTLAARTIFFNGRRKAEPGATIHSDRIEIRGRALPETTLHLNRWRLAGQHNRENAAAACLAALAIGGTPDGIQAGLDVFEGFPHRMEYIATIDQVQYYNDSKATNVDAVVRALGHFDHGVILILGGRNKGNDLSQLKPHIGLKTKLLIAMGEARQEIIDQLAGTAHVAEAASMAAAVAAARDAAQAGDTVLLAPACASFDMYKNYAERGEAFRQAVKNLTCANAT